MLFAFFLSVFAPDVFSEPKPVLLALGHLFLHLVPSFMVLGIVAVAWRREWLGALAFSGLALAFVGFPWRTDAALYAPLLLIAVLYLLAWRRRSRPTSPGQHLPGAV